MGKILWRLFLSQLMHARKQPQLTRHCTVSALVGLHITALGLPDSIRQHCVDLISPVIAAPGAPLLPAFRSSRLFAATVLNDPDIAAVPSGAAWLAIKDRLTAAANAVGVGMAGNDDNLPVFMNPAAAAIIPALTEAEIDHIADHVETNGLDVQLVSLLHHRVRLAPDRASVATFPAFVTMVTGQPFATVAAARTDLNFMATSVEAADATVVSMVARVSPLGRDVLCARAAAGRRAQVAELRADGTSIHAGGGLSPAWLCDSQARASGLANLGNVVFQQCGDANPCSLCARPRAARDVALVVEAEYARGDPTAARKAVLGCRLAVARALMAACTVDPEEQNAACLGLMRHSRQLLASDNGQVAMAMHDAAEYMESLTSSWVCRPFVCARCRPVEGVAWSRSSLMSGNTTQPRRSPSSLLACQPAWPAS
jgi:hypothetical protein